MPKILIDTNVMVLLVVGTFNRNLIPNHPKTKQYTKDDFDLLIERLQPFDQIWITSHCLAEISNLLQKGRHGNQLLEILRVLCSTDKTMEPSLSREQIFSVPSYPRLGVADAGLCVLAKEVDCILSDDWDAYNEVAKQHPYKTIDFTHIRQKHFF